MDSLKNEIGSVAWKQSLMTLNKQNEVIIQAIEHINEIDSRVTKTANEAKRLVHMAVDEMTIKYDEQQKIKSAVQSKAQILTKRHLKQIYGDENYGGSNFFMAKKGQFIRAIYSKIKQEFQVVRYTSLRRVDFQNAMRFINVLALQDFKDSQIRVTENQQQILDRWNGQEK